MHEPKKLSSDRVFNREHFSMNDFTGYCTIRYFVFGYWTSPISIHICVNLDNSFRINVTHSCGGRDNDVLSDDLQAESNFAHALIDATTYAKRLQKIQSLFIERVNN